MARDYDVIVVGSGAAGLSAALSAAREGARVLVVEGDTQVGGSSRLSGGHFYAAGTSVQAQSGHQGDTPEAMFEHYMTLNQWLVDPAVVRRYCDLSAPTFEWLQGLGVRFPVSGVYRSGVGSTPRGHQPEGGGEAVVQTLEGHCSHAGVEVLLNARVTRLRQDIDGSVTGVAIGDDWASCGAVILATGGFGANPAMIEKFYPQAAAMGDWRWYIGSDGAQGDGIALGEQVGATLAGHDRGLLLVTPGFSRDLEVLLPGWLILVNSKGRRFANEAAPYTVLGGLIQHQNGPVYAVFDEKARREAQRSAVSQAYWVDEILTAKADEGVIFRDNSVQGLARLMQVDEQGLLGTLARYNADVDAGMDSAFFKESGLSSVVEPPFYGVEVRPAIVCWTGAGLRIDADSAVLSADERPIPGLYAAGETVGNLHGDRYVGGGGSFGPCIVFGKLAGEQAARHAVGINQ